MSNKHHRVGVNELNLVIRHLRLTGVTSDNIDLIIKDIDSTMGVDAVSSVMMLHIVNSMVLRMSFECTEPTFLTIGGRISRKVIINLLTKIFVKMLNINHGAVIQLIRASALNKKYF